MPVKHARGILSTKVLLESKTTIYLQLVSQIAFHVVLLRKEILHS